MSTPLAAKPDAQPSAQLPAQPDASAGAQQRRILLVDADAFFVAVARQVDPAGAGQTALLIVGGNPGSRGVVCSASYECRAYGVRSAMPIARALRLCPEALCVPVPREACLSRSCDIQQVLARFAPVVQPSSIDEWYCDLSGTEALYRHEPVEATAHRIRNEVYERTGLRVSVGCGTSRLVAKLAVEHAKPSAGAEATGVFAVPAGSERDFLKRLKLSDLPMVGPRFSERLASLGLHTVEQAQLWTESQLVHHLGQRAGHWLARRVNGIDDSPVTPRERQKQFSRETTFSRDLQDNDLVKRELVRLAVKVSFDLRRQALHAKTVTVKLRNANFKTRTAQKTLPEAVESEQSIVRTSKLLFDQLRASEKGRQTAIRLIGVALSHFEGEEDEATGAGAGAAAGAEEQALAGAGERTQAGAVARTRASDPDKAPDFRGAQLGLFSANTGLAEQAPSVGPKPQKLDTPAVETHKERALSHALDRIRGKFGSKSIIRAQLSDLDYSTGPRVEE